VPNQLDAAFALLRRPGVWW